MFYSNTITPTTKLTLTTAENSKTGWMLPIGLIVLSAGAMLLINMSYNTDAQIRAVTGQPQYDAQPKDDTTQL